MPRIAAIVIELAVLTLLMGFAAPSRADDCPGCQENNVAEEPLLCDAVDCGWYFQAEALLLWRDNNAMRRPLVVQSDQRTELLGTGSLDFGLGAGPRLVLGRWLDEERALEAVYFGTHHWNDRVTLAGENNLSLPGDLGPATFDFDRADQMVVDSSSELQNAELNAVWRLGCLEYLGGFRYVKFAETINVRGIDADTGASDYHVRANNDLYGVQIGLRTRKAGERFGLELGGKIGLFGNDTRQRTSLRDLDNTFVLRDSQTVGANVAMVSELGLSATYRLTKGLWARAGYNVMWIEGIALAADQLDFTDAPRSGAGLDRDGGVFLHGVNIGLEGRW